MAAVAWGIAFVGASELTRVVDADRDEAGAKTGRESILGATRWVYAIALVAVLVIAIFLVILHIGGIRGHGTAIVRQLPLG